jgi:hypothetical protein
MTHISRPKAAKMQVLLMVACGGPADVQIGSAPCRNDVKCMPFPASHAGSCRQSFLTSTEEHGEREGGFAMALLAQLYALRWVLVAATLLAYAASKYRTHRRLAAFKGPFSVSWCEAWHSYHIIGSHSHLAYKAINEKYGRLLFMVRAGKQRC